MAYDTQIDNTPSARSSVALHETAKQQRFQWTMARHAGYVGFSYWPALLARWSHTARVAWQQDYLLQPPIAATPESIVYVALINIEQSPLSAHPSTYDETLIETHQTRLIELLVEWVSV